MKRIGSKSLTVCASLGLLTVAIACGSGDADPDTAGSGNTGNTGTGNTGNTSSGGTGNTTSGGTGNTTSGGTDSGGTDSGGTDSGGTSTGGTTAAASVCDGATRELPVAEAYIDNFETDVRFLGWYGFADDGNPEPHNGTREAGGALATGMALHVAASGITPPTGGGYGAGFGFNMIDPALESCVDVGAFDGLSFWAKGSSGSANTLTFQVVHPATAPVADGGDCTVTAQCYLHPKTTIEISEEWQQYSVLWADLSGSTATVTGPILGFNLITPDADYDVWLDEVTLFVGTEGPAGPVNPEEGGAGGAGAGGAGG
jgi:hypothetical protein